MWNPWKHLRLAGAATIFVGAIMSNMWLVFIGLLVQYTGVMGGLDLLERKFDILVEEEEKEKDDAVR